MWEGRNPEEKTASQFDVLRIAFFIRVKAGDYQILPLSNKAAHSFSPSELITVKPALFCVTRGAPQ